MGSPPRGWKKRGETLKKSEKMRAKHCNILRYLVKWSCIKQKNGYASFMLKGEETWMKTYRKVGRRCLAIFCTVIMLLVMIPVGGSYGQVEAASTATTTDYLYLRTGPGTSYDKILLMDKGATVTLVDNSDDEWAKVKTSSGKPVGAAKHIYRLEAPRRAAVRPPLPMC